MECVGCLVCVCVRQPQPQQPPPSPPPRRAAHCSTMSCHGVLELGLGFIIIMKSYSLLHHVTCSPACAVVLG